jgi:hypothetical protein
VTPRAPEALPWRALFAVLALAALAYANSFAGVPQYDDYNVIVDDPAVRVARGVARGDAGHPAAAEAELRVQQQLGRAGGLALR